MDKTEFEKRFLALVYQTNVVITPPNIAYNLSIPIEEAQEHLLALELTGTIQQQHDPQGGTFYTMPNRPAPGAMPGAGGLPNEAGGAGGPPGVYNPANLGAMPIYSSPATAPAAGRSINGLVLNVIFPGVGSLVCGKMIGLAMMALLILGIVLMFLPLGFGRLIGILPIVGAWIWSIIAGVGLLSQREPGPGVPT